MHLVMQCMKCTNTYEIKTNNPKHRFSQGLGTRVFWDIIGSSERFVEFQSWVWSRVGLVCTPQPHRWWVAQKEMSNLKCFAFVHQAWNVEPTPPRIPNPDPDQAEAQNEGSQMPKHYSKHYPKAQGRFRQSVNFVYVFVLNFIRTLLRRKLNTLLACWELEHGSINSFYLLYYIHIFYLSFIPLFVLLFT